MSSPRRKGDCPMMNGFRDRFLRWTPLLPAALLCLLLCAAGAGSAETLLIPADCRVIEAEAFFGDAGFDEAVLPEGVETVGSRAFAGTGLLRISLPASLVSIAEDALDHGVEVSAPLGSWALSWAVAHGFAAEPEASPAAWFDFSDNADGLTCTLSGRSGMPSGTA